MLFKVGYYIGRAIESAMLFYKSQFHFEGQIHYSLSTGNKRTCNLVFICAIRGKEAVIEFLTEAKPSLPGP